MTGVDMRAQVGSLTLRSPVMTASGTVRSADDASQHMPINELGAIVSKSMSCYPWEGHPRPNIAKYADHGVLNAIGLTNSGVESWCENELPRLSRYGATVVASIWGRSAEECAAAAKPLTRETGIVAMELNLSCPNLEDPRYLLSHDPDATGDVVSAVRSVIGESIPLWAKLSPNTPDIVSIAEAAASSGASAVTLINTLSGMLIDVLSRQPAVANGYGGVSGPLLFPIAVRAVHQVHQALPDVPIIGVGGITTGTDAMQMIMAGASAVQIGTAHFQDPAAAHRIMKEIEAWCLEQEARPADLVGVVRSRFASDYDE